MSSKNPIQLKRKEVRNAVKKTKSLPSNAASDDSRFKESSKEGKVRSANPWQKLQINEVLPDPK